MPQRNYNRTLISQKQEKGRRFKACEIFPIIFEIFFKWHKMRGNRNEIFLVKMNETFICLLAVAIRHCLRAYQIGDRLKNNHIEFKYEMAASK